MQTTSYDIAIVGGGVVGATLACALAQQTSLSIALIEAQDFANSWAADDYHHRVSAISLSSKRIFESLKVWDEIQAMRVSAFKQIYVWAEQHHIEFDSSDIAEPILGYIIENNAMQDALFAKLKKYSAIHLLPATKLVEMNESETGMTLVTADKKTIKAKLIVGADGAQSWIRNQAHIDVMRDDYAQTAIVTTVTTELSHQQTASQVFLPSGPLAFLPLINSNLSSIVWSLPTDEAKTLMALDEQAFKSQLSEAFSHRLGKVTQIEKRFSFPLAKQQASHYVKSRIALVGDAAHTVHPLAGQGVNIGLLDAASLAEIVVEAVRKRRDFASLPQLRRYERWRKADNLPMLSGVDGLKKLFANERQSLQTIRGVGLMLTNKASWIKNIFIRHAVGNRSGLPQLAMSKY